MLPILLSLGLLLPAAQENQGQAMNAVMQRNQLAVAQLVAAFEQEDPKVRVAALTRAGHLPDQRVLQINAAALRDKNAGVRRAAIEGLRFNGNDLATRLLRNEVEKGILPWREEATTVALIRGLCQKADPGCLPALQALKIDPRSRELTRTWVLGLGRLRDKRSVLTLINFLAGLPADTRCLYMDDIRTSLLVLTGTDHGLDAEAWVRWWLNVGEVAQIQPFDPQLPELLTLEWYGYWQVDPLEERMRQVARAQRAQAEAGQAAPLAPEPAGQQPQGQTDLGGKKSRRHPQANDWPLTEGAKKTNGRG